MHASLLAVLASSGEGPLVPHELRAADGYTNVMGTALVDCSSSNESLTGWTRNGQCVDAGADDEGSHHICVQMTSDFCVTTGQPDWCNQPGDDGKPIGHWCICQWAYAEYLAKKSSCEDSLVLKCDAVNSAAVKAYKDLPTANHTAALRCIESKCGLSL